MCATVILALTTTKPLGLAGFRPIAIWRAALALVPNLVAVALRFCRALLAWKGRRIRLVEV